VRITHILRANGYSGGERIVRLDNHVTSLGGRLEFAIGEILPESVSGRKLRNTQTDLKRGDTIPITCYLLHLVESQIGIQALLVTDRSARKLYIARKDVPITG
jgi:hypothetical protein